MTKRIEQSRRRGHYDPRFRNLALALVPEGLAPAPDEVPQDPAAFIGPVPMKLLPQPAPLGTEERVQL